MTKRSLQLRPKLFVDLHMGLHQQGPGSDEETARALRMLPPLGPDARILDAGCGPGRQTLVLARDSGAQVVAVDLLPAFIEECARRADAAGLADRIEARVGNMAELDLAEGSLDLIWSEGAIYNLGFEAGLTLWRPLLRPGGHLAASDASWLVPEPSRMATEFWGLEYPGMADVDSNLAAVCRAGYEPIGHFALAESSWWRYYDEQEARLPELRKRYAGNAEAQAELDLAQREYDLYREHAGEYGYVFYVCRRTEVRGPGVLA